MENQDDPRRHSKEECTSESRIKVHKRIKKVESAPNIRVHGRNILRQLVPLQRRTSMPIMPKRSLVHCAENVQPFEERPICMLTFRENFVVVKYMGDTFLTLSC